MSSRPVGVIGIVLTVLMIASGCTRPIVKQPVMGPGVPGPGLQPFNEGRISDQQLEVIQANLKPVYFDYDKYALSPEVQEIIKYNADILNRSPNFKVVCEGHCDERGTAEYNLALGDRRARAVMDYMIMLGVQPDRMTVVSYGSELPVDPGHNEAAWAKNRRVNFRVSR